MGTSLKGKNLLPEGENSFFLEQFLMAWEIIFMFFVLSCVCLSLCASVYMYFVVACWERADLLALV